MIKLIDSIEAAIAKALFFPVIVAYRDLTGLNRNNASFSFFLAALLSGALALAHSELFLFCGAMVALAIMLTAAFLSGRVHHRPIAFIRLPFLAITVFGTVPALVLGRIDLIVPMIFYLFSDYSSMIADHPSNDERK